MNREKQNEHNRQYYLKNSDWIRVKNRAYYHKNRVRILQKQKEKDDTRRPELRKYAREYHKENKEWVNEKVRRRYHERKHQQAQTEGV